MTRRHDVLLAVVVGLGGGALLLAEAPKELSGAAKKELKALEGKWKVVRFLHSDRVTTPDGVTVEFKGDTIDFAGAAKGALVGLDPATDPKCLDFKVPVGSGVLRKGSTYESAYKLDGDTLTWAVYHGRGKNRPLTFDRPTSAGVMVLVLRRVKE